MRHFQNGILALSLISLAACYANTTGDEAEDNGRQDQQSDSASVVADPDQQSATADEAEPTNAEIEKAQPKTVDEFRASAKGNIPDEIFARIRSREEFRSLVEGRNEEQVLVALGKPAGVREFGSFVYWDYEDPIFDNVTGTVSMRQQVMFREDHRAAVSFP